MTHWKIEISDRGRDPWEETIYPEFDSLDEALTFMDDEVARGLGCNALRLRVVPSLDPTAAHVVIPGSKTGA